MDPPLTNLLARTTSKQTLLRRFTRDLEEANSGGGVPLHLVAALNNSSEGRSSKNGSFDKNGPAERHNSNSPDLVRQERARTAASATPPRGRGHRPPYQCLFPTASSGSSRQNYPAPRGGASPSPIPRGGASPEAQSPPKSNQFHRFPDGDRGERRNAQRTVNAHSLSHERRVAFDSGQVVVGSTTREGPVDNGLFPKNNGLFPQRGIVMLQGHTLNPKP